MFKSQCKIIVQLAFVLCGLRGVFGISDYSLSNAPDKVETGGEIVIDIVSAKPYVNETYIYYKISCDAIKELETGCRIYFKPEETKKTVTFETYDAGICSIEFFTKDHLKISTQNITVQHSSKLELFCVIIGWVYFVCWSISFYPQVWVNYKIKNVQGLNFDFVVYNLSGWVCYSIFNVSLFWIPVVQKQYEEAHEDSAIPVLANDVFFALHALVLTLITVAQCFYYNRNSPGQRNSLSKPAKVYSVLFAVFVVLTITLSATNVMSWLTFITTLSYVKLAITLIKYIPQAYHNFKRKSTIGWSIENIILDFSGGSLSMLQMILIAYNTNDWITFVGNPTKMGIGLFSVCFDIFFMIQHYGLYANARHKYQTIQDEERGIDSDEEGSVNIEYETRLPTPETKRPMNETTKLLP